MVSESRKINNNINKIVANNCSNKISIEFSNSEHDEKNKQSSSSTNNLYANNIKLYMNKIKI